MPRTRGQRPISTPAATPSNNRLSTVSTRSQSGIQRFGRIGKAVPEESPSKKRKAFVHNDGDEEEEDDESTIVEAVEDVDETPRLKRSRKRLLLNRPLPRPPSEYDTPTRGTSGLLSALDLSQTPPMRPRFSPSKETMRTADTIKTVDTPNSPTDTPATSPCCSEPPSSRPSTQDRKNDELPQGLLDLIDLHSSFLGALSFYYAHNGISSPVDIRMLIPAITTKWGKRKVTIEDIRRSLGVMQSSAFTAHPHPALKARTFLLSDYGHGKICLEQQESRKARSRRSSTVISPSLDENALNALFSIELSQRWDEYRRKITPNSKSPQSVSYFISQMPLTEITTCPSLAKMGPFLAKGQQRLEDFKADTTSFPPPVPSLPKTKSLPSSKPNDPQTPAPNRSHHSRGASLLDRIRAKQTAAANAPPGPTPEERARIAALHRAEDVLATLSLMASTASVRVSFPLPRLVRDVQASSRTPVGADEVRRCVQVLADEVAKGYVALVKLGATEVVVVDLAKRVGSAEVRRRVGDALGEQL
ncbi:hypothetical protein IWX49DRAFT_517107 [Phyllosticta citricarpa]